MALPSTGMSNLVCLSCTAVFRPLHVSHSVSKAWGAVLVRANRGNGGFVDETKSYVILGNIIRVFDITFEVFFLWNRRQTSSSVT